MRTLLTSFLILLLAQVTWGAQWFVDATGGNAGYNGRSTYTITSDVTDITYTQADTALGSAVTLAKASSFVEGMIGHVLWVVDGGDAADQVWVLITAVPDADNATGVVWGEASTMESLEAAAKLTDTSGPEATISAAYADAVAVDLPVQVINIASDTYDAEASSKISFGSAGTWTSLYLKGYKPDVNFPDDTDTELSVVDRPVVSVEEITCTAADAGVAIYLQNLSIATSLTTPSFNWGYGGGHRTASLSVKWCDVTTSSTSDAGFYAGYIAVDATSAEWVTFDDCLLSGWTANIAAFRLRGQSVSTIKDCTINGGSGTSQTQQALCSLFSYNEQIVITGNTVASRGPLLIWQAAANDVWGLTTERPAVQINNNRITVTGYPDGVVTILPTTIGNSKSYTRYNPVMFEVIGNTITGVGFGVYFGFGYRDGIASGGETLMSEIEMVGRILNNTITVSGGHAILVGPDVQYAEVAHNTVSNGAEFGIVIKAPSFVHHNSIVGPTGLYLAGGQGSVVEYNSIYGITSLFNNAFRVAVNDNTNFECALGAIGAETGIISTGTAISFGTSGADLDHVKPGDLLQVDTTNDNEGIDGTAWFDITAVDDSANTMTVAQTPSSDFSEVAWKIFTPRPSRAVVRNNIFHYGTATNSVKLTGGSSHNILMDCNLVYGPAYINATSCTTLAGIQAAWLAWTGARTTNDVNSLMSDPLFISPTTGDLRVRSSSPAKGSQLGVPSLAAWGDLGAWQRKSGTGGLIINPLVPR